MPLNDASSIARLTLPHATFFSDEASATMNLSLGERPVWGAVLQTMGPSIVSWPSPRFNASS
jgi:hypothetical protein